MNKKNKKMIKIIYIILSKNVEEKQTKLTTQILKKKLKNKTKKQKFKGFWNKNQNKK